MHIAKLLHPLTSILSKKQGFALQGEAFANCKRILLSIPVLALYLPDKETRLTADASSYELGAVLLQKQPNGNLSVVSYASTLLTMTECHYGQIEKGGLALIWACKSFCGYLLRRPFQLEMDHKPLISIFESKSVGELTPLTPVNAHVTGALQLRHVYVPGKYRIVADALQKSPLKDATSSDLAREIEGYIMHVVSAIPVSSFLLEQLKQEKESDTICLQLRRLATSGWLSH